MGWEWRSYSFALVSGVIVFKDQVVNLYKDATGIEENLVVTLGVLFGGLLMWFWGLVFKVLLESDKEAEVRRIDKEIERLKN